MTLMNKKQLMGIALLILLLSACGKQHLISDSSLREEVEADFQQQMEAYQMDVLSVDGDKLSAMEKEAMMFLYAYMPIGDIADYENTFFLKNIRSSFQAKAEMPWGEKIPEDLFRHFVLPIRVNNENLDESRMVFFAELKERVKGLTLHDAVLEVNHWCHEKVVYTPSDSRTSAPLASVRTAYGRCGEESTFTVAALRSVGIPARQVYTPRWAHTDDNHAWVEAWVDGKWCFFGACEPEPVLNLGWFNAPASRGMLMHTKVFGKYKGAEEVMTATEGYTEINLIGNYAPTAKATVAVVDKAGKPVAGAEVEFKLYNYAEFYTVCTKTTDEKGECSLTAGKGDMLAWATKDGRYGFSKVSFGREDRVRISLDKVPGETASVLLDIVPPAENAILPEVSEAQRAANTKRMEEEDALRNAYVHTFYSKEKATKLSRELGTDPILTYNIMVATRGNFSEIERFLRDSPAEKRKEAMALLQVISEKDLRDTPAHVLADHLNNTPPSDSKRYIPYVANPRVANEFLSPYKKVLAEGLDASLKNNPKGLVAWVKQNIRLRNEKNEQRIPILPTGVLKVRMADEHSRDIFFVAAARSLGIAARIEPVAKRVQYFEKDGWVDVDFETALPSEKEKGFLTASYTPIKTLKDPKYNTHFTLSRMHPNGKLQTLRFESNKKADMGAGDQWSTLLKKPLALEKGNYVLVNGTRMASGSVLAKLTFIAIGAGEKTNTRLEMRENDDDVQVIGSFNSESKFTQSDGKETSILQTTGRGYYVLAILSARQEPTNHALRDIAAVREDLEKWGRRLVLLFPNEKNFRQFDAKEFGTLPANITLGIDHQGMIQKEITAAMKLQNKNSLPIFIVADTFNRVVFVSQGYTIGMGEQLLKVIHKL